MRSVLVTPLSPRLAGNGLAQRCAMWHEALAALGPVTTVVAPVAGPSAPDSAEVVVTAAAGASAPDSAGIVVESVDASIGVPRLARGLTVEAGHLAARREPARLGAADVVVAVRSYTALVGAGISEVAGAPLVVDLDDDDVAYFRSADDAAEAERFEHLVETLRGRADLVVSTTGFDGTTAVPNSVPVPPSLAAGSGPPLAVLVGNMGYEPNAAGARWLVDAVWPRVLDRIPGAQLVIAGPGSERFAPFGRGYVEDLAALYSSAAVAVVPIRHGSGTRIKILDAWAHGLAVVSTTKGAEGLGAVHGMHLLLADDEESFASAIVRTTEDLVLAAALGAAGRELVDSRFSRRRVLSDLQGILRNLV